MRSYFRSERARVVGAAIISCAIIGGAYIAARVVDAIELPTLIVVSICGDGIVTPPEVCDDGSVNNVGGYASSTSERRCNANCLTFGPYCGDRILQVRFTEQCDDGNNTSGDLCTAACIEETPVQPRATGAPPKGSIPQLPAVPGTIPSELLTKVVVRGKAFPNSTVNILLDGKLLSSVTADVNADFYFTSTTISPGTAVLGFNAKDRFGVNSIMTTAIFDVVQSAVTTVSNVLIPPTISAKPDKVVPGGFVTFSGQTAPQAHILTALDASTNSLESDANTNGDWALQIDTGSLKDGSHAAKARFEISEVIKSGWGKSISFYVGNAPPEGSCGAPDMNKDEKVNLVDFSIFLLSWNKTDPPADFNCDNRVNLADFSIMLFAWTG